MEFGNRLRFLIDESDITQKELAMHLNIAPSTISSYVQNAREPDFATLKLIAEYFGVTTDYLLDNEPMGIISSQEDELLRIFRSLSPKQKEICLEQCRVFMRVNRDYEKK